MHRAAPFVLRIVSSDGSSVRPFLTAAEAYDKATAARRTLRGAGSLLQVEDATTGVVLGQWRHDGARWVLEDSGAWSPRREGDCAG